MVLEARATAGGTIVTAGALGYVIAVNRTGGTITVSATAGGGAGTPVNWSTSFPFLNIQGDSNAKFPGLAAWLPTTAPGATPFFSVDRSSDSRLYGSSWAGANQSIEEAIIDAAAQLDAQGGQPDLFVLSTRGFSALVKAMGARAVVEQFRNDTQVGFRGIELIASSGPIKVIGDRFCPGQIGYMLQTDTWSLNTNGPAPQILDYEDGTYWLRSATTDSTEVRMGYSGALSCNAPAWNGAVTLAV